MLGVMALILGGCECARQQGGVVLPHHEADALQPGKTTQQSLLHAWGTPSTVSVINPNVWYYVSSSRETVAFFPPKLTQSKVYVVEFDQQGILRHVDRKDLCDMKEVAMVARTTPPKGQCTPLMRKFFRNLGNASARPRI